MTEPVGVPMPANLADEPDRAAWTANLPTTIRDLVRQWALTLGAPFQPGGRTAWVAPAHSASHGDVVLKVGWRHAESAHEPDGLREWDGDGAVRLHVVEERDDTIAMLLERCMPGAPLARRPEAEQDRVIAQLLPRLWREPASGHRFRPLQVMCNAWADGYELATGSGRASLDAGIARDGLQLFRSLPTTADRHVLLCTDLHAGNVLAADREPWLAIDPKPYVGDPTYDALQHMLNCAERLDADPRHLCGRIADLLELEQERLRLWLFARCVVESANEPALAQVAQRLAPA